MQLHELGCAVINSEQASESGRLGKKYTVVRARLHFGATLRRCGLSWCLPALDVAKVVEDFVRAGCCIFG